MDASDSENEGQLLIDESVDVSKKGRVGRKRGPSGKKQTRKKKKSAKLVVKPSTPRQRKPKVISENNAEAEPKTAVAVRMSTRTRKRVRKHSPSPVRKKKEPPKKRLKVKIKHIPKTGKKKKSIIANAEPGKISTEKGETKEVQMKPQNNTQNLDSVDIESVSEDELHDVQYSSVVVNENTVEKPKPKKKAGIKLKLSLGKLLTPKIAESLDDIVGSEKLQKDETSSLSSPEEEKQVVKPLIISKRRVSGEMSPNSKTQVSIIPTGNESPYYSSSSEDHKPLTLRLSVGRPKIPKRSISEFETHPKPFHKIQRSWSVTPAKNPEQSSNHMNKDADSTVKQSHPTEAPHGTITSITSKPYFSAGLQSLLDVVSVEINEQNKASTTSEPSALCHDVAKHPSPLSHPLSSNISNPAPFQKSHLTSHGREGHLPSMSFPKPKLHFSPKKRPRVKSVTNLSPQLLHNSTSILENGLLTSSDTDSAVEEPPNHILTEKERRRRDKKKILNDDFIDPDSIIQGADGEEKKQVRRKPLPPYVPTSKAGGFSLLMPQMKSNPASSGPNTVGLNSTSTYSLPNRSLVSKRPKKGMATAKQRLASKLKIGRAFAH